MLNKLKQELISELVASKKIDHDMSFWSKEYYRNDCDEKMDERELPYMHKNLSKIGIDLSSLIVVDTNPLVYREYEPNTIRCAAFWGGARAKDNEVNYQSLAHGFRFLVLFCLI